MPDAAQSRSSVVVLSLLLLLQVAGLAGAVVYTLRSSHPKTATDGTSLLTQHALAIAFLLIPTLVLTLVAVGCALFRRGWLPAMLTQVLALATYLWLYFQWRPIAVYPLMLYGVVMVLYLNSRTFRTAMHSRGQRVSTEANRGS
jgi:hypothetical protein